jgi:hypothetical protein
MTAIKSPMNPKPRTHSIPGLNGAGKLLLAPVLALIVYQCQSVAEVQPAVPVVVANPAAMPKPAVNGPLPGSAIAWDADLKSIDARAGDDAGHLFFSFTNVSPGKVVISSVHPGCGCTTAQLPILPWVVAAGANGTIPVTINLRGKSGTLYKNLTVTTDQGVKMLNFRVNILPVALPAVSGADPTNNVKSPAAGS